MNKPGTITINPEVSMTPEQLASMYGRFPNMLAEELACVFEDTQDDYGVAIRNHIVRRIRRMCRMRDELLKNVARAIIDTATQGVTNGKAEG